MSNPVRAWHVRVQCRTCQATFALPSVSPDLLWADGLYWHRPCLTAASPRLADAPGAMRVVTSASADAPRAAGRT